jgi:hypothetical protein
MVAAAGSSPHIALACCTIIQASLVRIFASVHSATDVATRELVNSNETARIWPELICRLVLAHTGHA